MIVDQLYTHPEPTVHGTRIFTEGRHKKLLKEDATYRQFHNLSRMIVERAMSEKEILDLFAAVEAGANAAGGNRTALGKGKDAVAGAYTYAKDAIGEVMRSIQRSTPVAGVDAAYNDATDALGKALGGNDSKIMNSIKKYRLLAKEYPKTQLFVKTALIALAGMATGGAGFVAIAGITAAVDAAIKGEKLSSLIGKGAGASLMALGAQEVQAMMSGGGAGGAGGGGPIGPDAGPMSGTDAGAGLTGGTPGAGMGLGGTGGGANPPDIGGNIGGTVPSVIDYTVKPGDVLSTIADDNYMSVEDLMQANPGITNADVLRAGQHINIPSATGNDVYANGVGTAADTAAKVASGAYTPNPRSPLRLAETVKYKILPVSQLIDHKLTVMGWALNESIGKKPGNSVHLTRNGVFTVIENVDRYRRALLKEYDPGSVGPGREALPDLYRPDQPGAPAPVTAKPSMIGRGLNWLDKTAGKVGGYLSKQAQNFTRKVTAAKLKMEWQQLGHPSDSDQIAAFLAKQGVPQPVITDVYGKMGIPYTAPATVPDGTPAPQQQQQGGAGIQTGATSLIDPETGKPYEKRKLAALHNQPAPAAAPGGAVDPHNIPYDADTGSTPAAGPSDVQIANLVRDVPKATDEVLSRFAARTDLHPRMKAVVDAEIAKRAPAPAKTPNFAGPTGYGKTTTSIPGMKAPAAGPNWDAETGAPLSAKAKAEYQAFSPEQKAEIQQNIKNKTLAAPAATQTAANPFRQMTRTLNTYAPPETTSTGGTLKQTATGQVHRASATNPNAQQQAAPAASVASVTTPTSGAAGGQMELPFSRGKPGGYAQGLGKTDTKTDPTAPFDKNTLNKKDSLATVGETIKQVKKMLETVQTRDDVNFIKKYINHEFDRLGMVNQLATVQRNHLIERVTQIAAGRRRDHAKQLAN